LINNNGKTKQIKTSRPPLRPSTTMTSWPQTQPQATKPNTIQSLPLTPTPKWLQAPTQSMIITLLIKATHTIRP